MPHSAKATTRACGNGFAGAGIGIVVGHALSIDSGQASDAYLVDFTAHHVRGTIGGLTIAVGAFLLLPGLAAALRLVTGHY